MALREPSSVVSTSPAEPDRLPFNQPKVIAVVGQWKGKGRVRVKVRLASWLAEVEVKWLEVEQDDYAHDDWWDGMVLVGGFAVRRYLQGQWTMREVAGRFARVEGVKTLILSSDPSDAELEKVSWLL